MAADYTGPYITSMDTELRWLHRARLPAEPLVLDVALYFLGMALWRIGREHLSVEFGATPLRAGETSYESWRYCRQRGRL
jgi:hypothetical protein